MGDKLTYRVKLLGSDEKTYFGPFSWLKQELGVCALNSREEHRFNWLHERIQALEEEIETLLVPKFEQIIYTFVKENPDIQTRQFTYQLWRKLRSRAERGAYDKALTHLEEHGHIIGRSHGPSLNKTWRIGRPPSHWRP